MSVSSFLHWTAGVQGVLFSVARIGAFLPQPCDLVSRQVWCPWLCALEFLSTWLWTWLSRHTYQASLVSCARITRLCFFGPVPYCRWIIMPWTMVYPCGCGSFLGSISLISLLILLMFILKRFFPMGIHIDHDRKCRSCTVCSHSGNLPEDQDLII